MTARLAVFGNPIEHSRSPAIHEAFGAMAGIDLVYEKVLVPEGKFNDLAAAFMEGGTGFNITVPYKETAWKFVDYSSEKADLAQAVNTISRDGNGKVVGDNTDGAGLIKDLLSNLGWVLESKKLLVLGAGGAVSGVLGDLLDAGPCSVDLWNRTQEKAQELELRFDDPRLRSVETDGLSEGYDLIINGTSAGLSGQMVALPSRIVADHTRCYDMIYGETTTSFNSWCLEQANCQVADGLGMLVEQAALAFMIWFDSEVETASVISRLRASLQHS